MHAKWCVIMFPVGASILLERESCESLPTRQTQRSISVAFTGRPKKHINKGRSPYSLLYYIGNNLTHTTPALSHKVFLDDGVWSSVVAPSVSSKSRQ